MSCMIETSSKSMPDDLSVFNDARSGIRVSISLPSCSMRDQLLRFDVDRNDGIILILTNASVYARQSSQGN